MHYPLRPLTYFACRFPKMEMPANVAYQLITDSRQLDCNPRCPAAIQQVSMQADSLLEPVTQTQETQDAIGQDELALPNLPLSLLALCCRLNLASFVTTWMVPAPLLAHSGLLHRQWHLQSTSSLHTMYLKVSAPCFRSQRRRRSSPTP